MILTKNYNFIVGQDMLNLIYCMTGTKFGLQTNGNIDAIFMSLPPSTGWI